MTAEVQPRIEGYRSADESDILYITATTVDGETLYATARVKSRGNRKRVSLSAFETPEGITVEDRRLARMARTWALEHWPDAPLR